MLQQVWVLLLEMLALQKKPEKTDSSGWESKASPSGTDGQKPDTTRRFGPVLDLLLKD